MVGLPFLQWRREGELIRQGLNLYRPDDPSSVGGHLRIGRIILRARFSRPQQRWLFNCNIAPKTECEAWPN
jgi:hypothetical protein